ncbi:RAB6-interacting golgin [Bufo bufo]|uniref:RAB6-interacting golgin n=1 Tax=Bufo bufo TaxID=8384 RepID=UPI001ABE71EB|nr:RAB6-interacting golgin [Bufo bufo]
MSASARMAGWPGFSEDELKRMRPPQELPYPRGPDACLSEAFLSHPQHQTFPKKDKAHHSPSFQKNTSSRVHLPNSTQVRKPLEEKPKEPVADNKEIASEPPSIRTREDDELSKKEVELKEKSCLKQLQLKQRLMEEKNKRKKAILAKAIAERSKRTQAEAVKLNRIQKQLQALDEIVSTDIGILRNRIEQACMEFSQAKKRYDRAESEYVAAKLDLYKKTQVKEQLTEHLCTIIQQNELRKAKKLEELMQQLEVEADEERLDLEIEVEQMLQQQETETRKPLVSSTSEKSQQVSKLDCSKLPSEKEFTTETDQGQFMTGTTSNIGDTNKINQKDSVHSAQGDSILS